MREFVKQPRVRDKYGYKHGYRLQLAESQDWAHTGRTLRLTPKGDRQAFIQALERIQNKRSVVKPPQGV